MSHNAFANGDAVTAVPVTRLKIVQSLVLEYPPFGVVGTTDFTSYHYYRQGDLYPYVTSTLSDFNIPILEIDEEQTTLEVAAFGFLGTPHLDQNRISIAPNPVRDQLTVAGDNLSVRSISITDVNGRTMLANVNSNSIDVSSLASGVYFAQVETDQGNITKKIIKP